MSRKAWRGAHTKLVTAWIITRNIARGTTDPGYWLFNLSYVISPAKYNACIGSKLGQHVMQLELVPSLATRWCYLHYLQNCPPDGAICISCKFGHQMAPLALVPNLATRWRYFHWLQIWPPDGTTCIGYKFSYQVKSLALVAKLSTRWRHLH